MRETLILFNAGVPLGEIASLKRVKLATVYDHIAGLIDSGMITEYGSFLSRSQYERVREEFERNPDGAYEVLSGEMDSGIIKIARAVMRARSRRS